MYSFYVFEGSFHQGGGGWEDIEVSPSLPDIQQAALDYIRLGNWASAADDFVVRVYQAGRLALEEDLYPFLQVKVTGLTPISFLPGGEPAGGVPHPGSEYEEDENQYEDADEWLEYFLVNEFEEIASERPNDIEVTIDWGRLALPELTQPVLPEGKGIWVRQEKGNEQAWGDTVAVETAVGPNDNPEEYGRYLMRGFNSIFS
ncbi:hypothetical protein BFF78_01260 [Streptomyces fodineus]|uniref:Uncharacterized protein n=1 Tax=Streptomyces fodineus TaxID=1904616 RepID=A0A1D7Y3D0_9ACTN|nr:hypothetical protein [Streptomyces fodineus]AOR29889.1 hypothetical protein BFF78_01260 [Streptomyces fodineus]